MDEAERCHEIAYIAFGEVLTRGTVHDVIAQFAFDDIHREHDRRPKSHALADELKKDPGVEMVAPFGNSLHVSGRDEAALEAAIAPYRGRRGSGARSPSLEDVFIDLMGTPGQFPMSALAVSSPSPLWGRVGGGREVSQ